MNHLLSLIALIPCKNVFSTVGEELDLWDELDDMVFPISSFFILHLNFFIPWEPQSFHLKIPGIGLGIGLVGGSIELITALITLHTKSLH